MSPLLDNAHTTVLQGCCFDPKVVVGGDLNESKPKKMYCLANQSRSKWYRSAGVCIDQPPEHSLVVS